MALVKVSADRRYLLKPQGRPFFVVGVNYNGYFDRAWKMWEANLFDADLVARDFRKTKNCGFNAIRLFVDGTLSAEIRQGNFAKLDNILNLAQEHELRVLLTLNDEHNLNLAQVGALDVEIVKRYKNMSNILAYDLQNEPLFYDLAAVQYPAEQRPPLQTEQLIDHYGVRVKQEDIPNLKRRRYIPAHLDDEIAFYYINALHLFREFDAAVKAFAQGSYSTPFDFIISEASAEWHPFIGALDQTIQSWLTARITPLREAGCQHLLTVGWNFLPFALLPANRSLDFQSYHQFTPLTLPGFDTHMTHLSNLRRAFPDHPVLLTEFGWSNRPQRQTIDPEMTALYETAMLSYLRSADFAGGFKWMLNDIQDGSGSEEAHFGLFAVGDKPKPISQLVQQCQQDWPEVEERGVYFAASHDNETGLAYRFDLPQLVSVGGHQYQDNAISWQAEGVAAHCFLQREIDHLTVEAHGAGQLLIEPWNFIAGWNQMHEADVYRVYSEQARTRQASFAPGKPVVIEVRPGAKYLIKMGVAPAVPVQNGMLQVTPNLGEHVVVLPDSEQYLPAALKYIRRFSPDITFEPQEVAGRWAYVTVIAPPETVSDAVLDEMRGMGSLVVERVVGADVTAVQATLDDLAGRGQRFLTPPNLPQEEPRSLPPLPYDEAEQSYVVQSGDTLSRIAQRVYGDFQQWQLIFEANQDQLADPNLLRAGMVLRLPERE